MKRITAVDLSQKIEKGESYIILDVREPYERKISKIDSIHIPMAEIVDRFNELPADQNIAVMCRSGQRAEAVVNLLESKYQMTNLWLLEGGLMAWIDQVDHHLEKY